MRMMPMLGAVAALLSSAPALAQVKAPVSATSPDGKVAVELTLDGDGRALYTVTRNGKAIIAPSRLGFLFTDVAKIDRRLEVTGSEVRDFDQTWNQPWGEWASIRNHYRELKVHLRETTALARVFAVTFRIYDDGVGFRYEFPQQPQMAKTNIADELTEFTFAQDGTAWLSTIDTTLGSMGELNIFGTLGYAEEEFWSSCIKLAATVIGVSNNYWKSQGYGTYIGSRSTRRATRDDKH